MNETPPALPRVGDVYVYPGIADKIYVSTAVVPSLCGTCLNKANGTRANTPGSAQLDGSHPSKWARRATRKERIAAGLPADDPEAVPDPEWVSFLRRRA